MYIHPFDYDYDDKYQYTSFMAQRKASYKKTKEEQYEIKKFDLNEFYSGTDIPTPAIKEIDGYKSEEEISDASTGTTSESESTDSASENSTNDEVANERDVEVSEENG